MPIVQQSGLPESRWFQAECHYESEREITSWDSRHVALARSYITDWMSNKEQSSDWWTKEDGVTCPASTLGHEDDQIISIGLARRLQAEPLRVEFEALAKKWQRDTRHISLISKKIAHPAYFRITGMGAKAIPLLLEALRDNPAHWFAALRATANLDPSLEDANPSMARESWLKWGRAQGLID